MDASQADAYASLVLQKYASLPSKLKVQATEWTVLAGVVADKGVGADPEVLAVSTGTKCLGSAGLVDGFLVRDSHAEVLCRRALVLLLLEDLDRLRNKGLEGRLLEQSGDAYMLKRGTSLHLVISDAPCGCASDFERLIIGGAPQSGLGNPRVSGAKRVHVTEAKDDDLNVRTKPYRSDLPPEKRSRCMSCSDKLLKWHTLGLHGALLSLLGVQSVRLSSVVLLKDAALTCIDAATDTPLSHEALDQAKGVVLSALQASFSRLDHGSDRLPLRLGLSLEHSFSNSRVRISPPAQGRQKSNAAGKATWWACNGGCESLVGVRGVKEGSGKRAEPERVASALSKTMLFRAFLPLYTLMDTHPPNLLGEQSTTAASTTPSAASQPPRTYLEWKQQAQAHRIALETFRERVKHWNVNEMFDRFYVTG